MSKAVNRYEEMYCRQSENEASGDESRRIIKPDQ